MTGQKVRKPAKNIFKDAAFSYKYLVAPAKIRKLPGTIEYLITDRGTGDKNNVILKLLLKEGRSCMYSCAISSFAPRCRIRGRKGDHKWSVDITRKRIILYVNFGDDSTGKDVSFHGILTGEKINK